MLSHLPILQVIFPLLAAPTCLILRNVRFVWLFAVLVSAATLAISIALIFQVNDGSVIVYSLGGWEAPWGIEYRIDILNAYVLLIVSALATLALTAGYKLTIEEISESNQTLFYTLYLLCFAGLLGIVATGDAFNVFVFLEISSLSTYALIALGKDRRALWAAYQYLIMGTIGATFILIGIGFLYMLTGTLNMLDLAQRISQLNSSTTLFAAFGFIIVGICLKLALFPLHLWLPNAYTYAPSIVTVFIAATATKVAIYLIIRFIFTVFGSDFSYDAVPLKYLFLILGFLGVFIASVVAIYQSNIKRLFAYSSVAQIGYMIIGLSFGTVAGLQATLIHVFNHALIKGALFLALGAVVYRLGNSSIESFNGLGKRMPWTMAAIVIGGLSLIGVPLTVGFVSKWYLIVAALDSNLWPVAVLVVVGSLLAIVYVWRVVEAAYFSPPNQIDAQKNDGSAAALTEAPLSLLIPVWFVVLANVYFGIDTRLTVSLSEIAANYLIGTGAGL